MPKTINSTEFRKMVLVGAKLLEINRAKVDALNVFPVPAVDYVTVQSANAINVLRVVNVNGAVVKAVSANGVNSLNLYVGDLAAGVYFVAVNNAAPVRIIKK